MTPPESADGAPGPPAPPRPSLAQILASVLTAVTTTFALSYLGVVGTIIGAGLASTFTVLANYWYTRSILHTQRKVAQLAPKVVRARPGARTMVLPRAGSEPDADATQRIARGGEAVRAPQQETTQQLPPVPAGASSEELDPHALMAPARAGRRRFVIPILVIFLFLLVLITAIELGLGKPLSDALRGQEGSGTSVFHSRTQQTPPDSGPTGTPEPSEPESSAPEPSQTPSQGPSSEPSQPTPNQEPVPGPTTPEPPEPEPTQPVEPTQPPDPGAGEADEADGTADSPEAELEHPDPQQPPSGGNAADNAHTR